MDRSRCFAFLVREGWMDRWMDGWMHTAFIAVTFTAMRRAASAAVVVRAQCVHMCVCVCECLLVVGWFNVGWVVQRWLRWLVGWQVATQLRGPNETLALLTSARFIMQK